jgi:hypothetical protein
LRVKRVFGTLYQAKASKPHNKALQRTRPTWAKFVQLALLCSARKFILLALAAPLSLTVRWHSCCYNFFPLIRFDLAIENVYMFTFNEVYRRATDQRWPLVRRWSDTKRCIFKYARLTRQDYSTALDHFCALVDLDRNWFDRGMQGVHPRVVEEKLLQLLPVVAEQRAQYLREYERYWQRRERDKQQGRLRSYEWYLRHWPDRDEAEDDAE